MPTPRISASILSLKTTALGFKCTTMGLVLTPEKIQQSGGMGLRGIQERIEQLGGSLTIDSELGSGTIVQVNLDL